MQHWYLLNPAQFLKLDGIFDKALSSIPIRKVAGQAHDGSDDEGVEGALGDERDSKKRLREDSEESEPPMSPPQPKKRISK